MQQPTQTNPTIQSGSGVASVQSEANVPPVVSSQGTMPDYEPPTPVGVTSTTQPPTLGSAGQQPSQTGVDLPPGVDSPLAREAGLAAKKSTEKGLPDPTLADPNQDPLGFKPPEWTGNPNHQPPTAPKLKNENQQKDDSKKAKEEEERITLAQKAKSAAIKWLIATAACSTAITLVHNNAINSDFSIDKTLDGDFENPLSGNVELDGSMIQGEQVGEAMVYAIPLLLALYAALKSADKIMGIGNWATSKLSDGAHAMASKVSEGVGVIGDKLSDSWQGLKDWASGKKEVKEETNEETSKKSKEKDIDKGKNLENPGKDEAGKEPKKESQEDNQVKPVKKEEKAEEQHETPRFSR